MQLGGGCVGIALGPHLLCLPPLTHNLSLISQCLTFHGESRLTTGRFVAPLPTLCSS